jgi:hypothetical protein
MTVSFNVHLMKSKHVSAFSSLLEEDGRVI